MVDSDYEYTPEQSTSSGQRGQAKGEAEEVVQEGGQPAGTKDMEAEGGDVGVQQAKEQMFSDKMTYIELRICKLGLLMSRYV